MSVDQPIDEVANELQNLAMEIADIKTSEQPSDLSVAMTLMNAIKDPAYDTAKFILEDLGDPTLEKTLESLKRVEQRLKDGQETETANKAINKGKAIPKCSHCPKRHNSNDCWDWQDNTDEGKKWVKEHPNEVKPRPENYRKSKSDNKQSKNKPRGRGAARAAKDESNSDSEDSAWMAQDDQHSPGWVIDSGASRHMTYNKSIFTQIKLYRTTIRIANGEKLFSVGVGTICTNIDGKNIRMTDVLFVPELDVNLLSIAVLNRKGLNVSLNRRGVEIFRDGTLVATGILKGRAYFLHTSHVTLEAHDENDDLDGPEPPANLKSTTNLTSLSSGEIQPKTPPPITPDCIDSDPVGAPRETTNEATNEAQYWLWHTRLGHPNDIRLQQATGKKFSKAILDLPCQICNLTKMTRTISKIPFSKPNRTLDRIHTDVWGPYNKASLGGHTYFVSLIDDYTRKSWLFCMKSRADIYRIIKDWKAMVELEKGLKIIRFRADNAKEYKYLAEQLQPLGIRMEPTTAYTPQQNGLAERFNRTIVQMVRSMLVWAKLPQSFWGEAAVAANHLRNFLPTTNTTSPNESWTGLRPNIITLRTFGCVSFVHVPKEKRSKLDNVSYQAIFTGYHSSNQYRLYNVETKKVEIQTSIKFDEKRPGGSLLTKGLSSPSVVLNDDNSSDDNESSPPTNHPTTDQVGVPTNGDQHQGDGIQHQDDDAGAQDNLHQDDAGAQHENNQTQETNRTPSSSPTRRSNRRKDVYNRYEFDNSYGNKKDRDRANIAKQPSKVYEPQSYNQAMQCTDHRKWKIAIQDELNALAANNTWKYVERPADKNIITARWVFKVKYTPTNHVDRYKARLVARGFKQIPGTDYWDTFSPTLRYESLRMLLYFACKYNFHIEQMDAPNAYLQSSLDDEIYMEPPQGLVLPPHLTNHVLRVLKGLYCLKQSGRGWNKKITNYLTSIGFKALSGDNCVFVNHTTHVIISLYFDDFLIFSKSMTAIKELKSLLIKEYNMKDLGPAKFILGIRIRREKDKIMIDQSSYIRSFLQKYKMDKANSVLTPMINYDACSPAIVNEPRTNQLEYQERIGSLMFLMINTCHEIEPTRSRINPADESD